MGSVLQPFVVVFHMLKSEYDGWYFADKILKCIRQNIFSILIAFSPKLVLNWPVDN